VILGVVVIQDRGILATDYTDALGVHGFLFWGFWSEAGSRLRGARGWATYGMTLVSPDGVDIRTLAFD